MRLTCCLFVSLSVSVLFSGCPQGRAELRTLTHEGVARTYYVYIPSAYKAAQPAPLVLVLHGGSGTARQMEYLTGFNAVAEREGFIVVYPEGVDRQWNDGRPERFGNSEANADDVGFMDALIDQLARDFSIDSARVHATGASNGAMMCHRLACELTQRFAAIAPVIGAMPVPLDASCAPTAPMPMIMFNGMDDRLVPWDGGHIAGRPEWGSVRSVPDTVQYWAAHNQCDPMPVTMPMPNLAPFDGTRVYRETYSGGEAGNDVVLYRVEGGGHTWSGGARYQRQWLVGRASRDISASEVIWAFFANHAR